jgi:hypothetical protein
LEIKHQLNHKTPVCLAKIQNQHFADNKTEEELRHHPQ